MNKAKNMINSFSKEEILLAEKITELKNQAGSHSPSVATYKQKLPELNIKVDACFLSNPYATELFLKYFNDEIIETNKIRDLIEFYPSQNAVIAELLGNFLNICPENVFIANGAIEIIQAIIHNFTQKKILINIPTFSSYYEYAKPGIEIVFNKLKKEKEYQLDLQVYIEKVRQENPDTIVLINPNNPNGAYLSVHEIQLLLDALPFVKTIILDESFIHFAFEEQQFKMVSIANAINKYPNLVVIKSMSKDFGIAGIRAGYGIMSKERVCTLLAHGYLWNSSGLAEYFFRLYTRADFANSYNNVRITYIKETQHFINELKLLPYIRVYPGKANFVMIELLNGISSQNFVSVLLIRYGIYVRTCSDKIGLDGEFIRLASRSKKENKIIINSIKECLLNVG